MEEEYLISHKLLRRFIGYFGFSLPILMLLVGNSDGFFNALPSISDYYYTNARDFFVGLLWAIGIFLITYKGYDQ